MFHHGGVNESRVVREVQRLVIAASVVLIAVGCATRPVRMDEPRRVVGTENNVRVDAEILFDANGAAVAIKYDVTNGRTGTIAVADILPDTSFDPEARMVTVSLGSEVPGARLLPRLVSVPPGQKRSFTAGAQVAPIIRRDSSFSPQPAALRLKLNFLGDTTPFSMLLDIPEKAVADQELADTLFPRWVELNEVVYTNAVPFNVRSTTSPVDPSDVSARRR